MGAASKDLAVTMQPGTRASTFETTGRVIKMLIQQTIEVFIVATIDWLKKANLGF